jgi:lipopolysaccharide biosynthesis protein
MDSRLDSLDELTELEVAKAEVIRLQATLNAVLASRSWRVTAPFRVWSKLRRESAIDRMVERHVRNQERGKLHNVRVSPVPLLPSDSPSTNDSVCAIVHVFYPDLLAEIVRHLVRCRELKHLFLTYCETIPEEILRREVAPLEAEGVTCELIPVENRGRDMAPFLFVLPRALQTGCKVFIKLHTKKSPHLAVVDGEAWRRRLLNGLLGNPSSSTSIVSTIAEDQNFGFAVPASCAAGRESWGQNRRAVTRLLRSRNYNVSRHLVFPAGSMFWFGTTVGHAFADLNLTAADFPPEEGQLDGTTAHVLERLVYFLCKGRTIWLITDQ